VAEGERVWAMTWSPQDDCPAVGLVSRVEIWDPRRLLFLVSAETWKGTLCLASWHSSLPGCLAWAPNSTMLAAATGRQDHLTPVNTVLKTALEDCDILTEPGVMIWPLDPDGGLGSPVALSGPVRAVNSVSWSPDGSRIATGSDDGHIYVWHVGPSIPVREPFGSQTLYGITILSLILIQWSTRLGKGKRSRRARYALSSQSLQSPPRWCYTNPNLCSRARQHIC